MKKIRFLTVQEVIDLGVPDYEIECASVELVRSPDYLRDRLESIGFVDLGAVLDCACGIGHWAAVAGTLNGCVTGLDRNYHRLRLAAAHARLNALENLFCVAGNMEDLPFPQNSFNGVFCYGAFMFARPRRVIREFHRVLTPHGRLYINANGRGWYWVELVRRSVKNRDLSSLRASLTFTHRALRRWAIGSDLNNTILSRRYIRRLLEEHNFEVIGIDGEGRIGTDASLPSIYPPKFGVFDGIFEALAVKKD